MRPPPLLLPALLTALLLTGCASGSETVGAGDGDASPRATSTSRDADRVQSIRTKFRFYLQDACATGDPARVHPRCGRFVTEIRNALPQIHRDVPEAAGAARTTEAALDRYARAGCEGAPGSLGAGDPGACAEALTAVQQAVRGLADALGVPG
ncbi:hypothetical protein H7X46_05330 [Pseudonocardia sp. C8]|uniref:hypothetical protein n=1 Tax=Pseudonocardia sp. C8 TaxID=2762759 RepID=UPI0016435EB7|nr:hypothetical protein [Pseudonocardia sp. C8]MBC3190484.1 hypothetical protein [Pseudonocardia sp. C8]